MTHLNAPSSILLLSSFGRVISLQFSCVFVLSADLLTHRLPLSSPCRGVFDIVVSGTCVGQYNNKGSFGELALMYNTPRAATIVATQDGALWGLVSM